MSLKNYSPLRYPGGKNKLSKYVGNLIKLNDLNGHTYVEPFAGGAAVGLYLLINGHVDNIIINDYDRSIYAFWRCVLSYPNKFCELIKNTPITMDEWYKQKEIQNNKKNARILELGFSTFFLNRTNRSGIIKAGVIGGYNQNGNYKMDCRFNKEDLIERIKLISRYKRHIKLYNYDAIELIDKIIKPNSDKTFTFFDPPYYNQGSNLYVNFYKHQDHVNLANKIKELDHTHKWIVTYDNTPEIFNIYNDFSFIQYPLKYTVERKYYGVEVLFYSKSTIINAFDKN
ncbi:putative adenine-specific DNA methyltransferase [Clostridium perfringens ATCC 13124]|uniref:site-specific DNA-methyltransferase (adenine-specific) n=1 Tax=Clostridium perfringens (strain ATCC 13124 / DSM 756 / JCM 1290 / NCIMB 6125 / NCTC 8237 / Type A) TaxID=195103 RepID=A0A0H2YTV9_CLOP1|nr:DNA adenine methylase [Clostridium perfringens]ABG84533.1 putative adenine-specific DNA methyltransferase [Clostridium perfringens ATCC 13124]MDM0932770.1 DNA adenine methylase [Clostridium perfringens]